MYSIEIYISPVYIYVHSNSPRKWWTLHRFFSSPNEMRAYCCQQWVGQPTELQLNSDSDYFMVLPPLSLLPFLPRFSRRGSTTTEPRTLPRSRSSLSKSNSDQILILPSCQHLCLYPAKYCFRLKAGGNGGWKYEPALSPLALSLCTTPQNCREAGQNQVQGLQLLFL